MTRQADREFLFEYHFGGSTWGTSVWATDEAQAREKIKAVGMSRYVGECYARIPSSIPAAGIFVRAYTWFKNRSTGERP